MRPALVVMCLMGCALGMACAPPDEARVEAASMATAGAEKAIMELESTWSRKFGEKDLDWIAAHMAENTRVMPPNAEAAVGRDAVVAWWQGMAATEGLSVSWESTEAHVAPSGDMAYDVGTYVLTDPDGHTDRGKYLVVWIMEDGQWKIAADMFSSNLPPPADTP